MDQRKVFWGAGLVALALICAACGGGSTDSPVAIAANDPLAPPDARPLADTSSFYSIGDSGVGGDGGGDSGANGSAGDGAPLKFALVTLTDAAGHQVTGQTDENGRYLIKYKSAVFVAPFILRVVDAGGGVLASVLEAAPAPGMSALVNINPLTDKVTSESLLADSAGVSGTDKEFGGSRIDKLKLIRAKADLKLSLKDAILATGYSDVSKFDPVKSNYPQDGTGVDAVIESLSHTRDSANGLTRLSIKLVPLQNDADGLVQPTLVTVNSPLPATKLVVPGSPALTFDKLQAWVAAMNRCLALSPANRAAETECNNAGGDRLISSGHLNNGNYVASDVSLPAGSTLRNPVVLFTSRYRGSSVDDAAWVEFTVRRGSGASTNEFTRVLTFKRDDTLVHAKAGNWILNGNQSLFGCRVTTEYLRQIQFYANAISGSSISSGLGLNCNPAGMQYVIVKGPGLPASGITLAQNTTLGGLSIDNKNGQAPAGGATTNVGSIFIVAAVAPDGSPIDWTTRAATAQNATVPVTDFSAYQAYAKYTFEIHLLPTIQEPSPPPLYEYAYNLASVVSPLQLLRIPFNDLTPSLPLIDAANFAVPAATSLNVEWVNNLNAAPVFSAFVQAGTFSTSASGSGGVNVAYTANNAPSSRLVTSSSGAFPALNPGNASAYRFVGVVSNYARANFKNTLLWTN